MDFAENYSFVVEDAVQDFNWTNTQAIIHPFVVYYLSYDCNIQCRSYCIISGRLKDDINAIHSFIKAVVTDFKEHVYILNKCIYFSDGAGPQYKNYKKFIHFKMNAEWHFFLQLAKIKVHVMRFVRVRCLVAKVNLQKASNGNISTLFEIFNWCKDNISGITFFYISKTVI